LLNGLKVVFSSLVGSCIHNIITFQF
jgi:hypothetical protein